MRRHEGSYSWDHEFIIKEYSLPIVTRPILSPHCYEAFWGSLKQRHEDSYSWDHEFIIKEYSPHWYEAFPFWGSLKQRHEGSYSWDHEFIINEYSPHWYEAFWGSPKQIHESLYSKWTISYNCGESCSSNIVLEPCPKLSRANRLVNPQMSNKGLQKKKESSRASIKG